MVLRKGAITQQSSARRVFQIFCRKQRFCCPDKGKLTGYSIFPVYSREVISGPAPPGVS